MPRSILLVDGDTTVQAALVHSVSALGCDVKLAFDGAEAISRLRTERFDLCLTDMQLPGPDIPSLDGFSVLREAAKQRPAVPVVMLTGQATLADAVAALRAGAVNFLPKPFHFSALEEVLRRAFASAAGGGGSGSSDDVGYARRTPGAAVIGEHPAMRAVLERVACVSDTDASVLIRGETGTGKEVVARLIHASSRRSAGPFVAVNMAAIPESLAESELFGHVRGAFTGAERPRLGRFMAAHEGTLFFDEIGDMPKNLQAKLLRVLQDRTVCPVGSVDAIPIDVRVVAATHRDLEEMVRRGTFREDLYYRLEVVPIDVPPLRTRQSDIPALVEHFRREVNLREGRSAPTFSPEVIDRLYTYDWPGNVRELENLVERMVILAGAREVEVGDLPPHLRVECVDIEKGRLDLPPTGIDLRSLLSELEDRLIGQALARTGGNKNRAAELLGLNRTTLVEKLRRRNVA